MHDCGIVKPTLIALCFATLFSYCAATGQQDSADETKLAALRVLKSESVTTAMVEGDEARPLPS